MIRTDRGFSEAVEKAVREAERGTAAELIVVVAARSGSYLDLAIATGAAVSVAVLAAALYIPATVPPSAVLLEVPVALMLATWLAHRAGGWLRALCPAARMKAQVERAAAAHFIAEAVHGTRARTGLLVYVSLLEERVHLLPDLGLQGRVPPAAWHDVRFGADADPLRARTQDDLLRGIAALGDLLRTCVPDGGGDVNEASDAPRIVG